ncbi:MAG: glycosyltransferase family 2 protein [Omnitrophica bacterium]|nr:glycosyltransferase family 2 protein [Candidatus Omnitrophota bacterium]
MKCDIIIPIWNQPKHTKSCIEHLISNTKYPYRLILIDNGSSSDFKNYLEKLASSEKTENILIRNEQNLGFVKAVNQGLRVSKAPYVCILNNDTLPGEGWLRELVRFAEKHPNVGLLNPLCNGHLTRNLTVNEYAKLILFDKGRFMEMNQCQGFCMLIKRKVINRIGYLDDAFGVGGFDDTDYSMRAHLARFRSVCVYSSYVYHAEHASFDALGDRKKIQKAAEKKYFKKWPGHRRIVIVASISKATPDSEVNGVLNKALAFARGWCWVNLLVFGDKSTKGRIEDARAKMDFPLHQNIKFNFLNERFKMFEIAARILERSFGRKRRKKYDMIFFDKAGLSPVSRALSSFQGCKVLPLEGAWVSREPVPDDAKCDIILPVCGQYEYTKQCIESIIAHTITPYKLIVINNGRDPKTKGYLGDLAKDKRVESVIIENDRNVGWGRALNQGLECSDAPYICFQNNDTVVTRGWIRKMINILTRQDNFGLINPTWEGRPEGASIDGYNSVLEKAEGQFVETDWCRGFSTVIKKSVVKKIGKMDEAFGLAYFEDVDYSIRAIEAGFLSLKALDTYVYHERNVTAFEELKGKKWSELHEKNKLICHKKWGRPLKIAMFLSGKSCKDLDLLERMEDTVFYLARKQHHVDIWTPRRLNGRFPHTNVRLRVCPPILFDFLTRWGPFSNKTKKTAKKYNAVFRYGGERDFEKVVKETVDTMKEKTKEA